MQLVSNSVASSKSFVLRGFKVYMEAVQILRFFFEDNLTSYDFRRVQILATNLE